jgi:hypothetical protein
MAAQRESLFRCTFSSSGLRRVAHVSAWDHEDAVQLFHAELQGDGVDEAGTIEVEPLAGTSRRLAEYRPGEPLH